LTEDGGRARGATLRALHAGLGGIDRVIVFLSMVGLVLACVILSASVVMRYFLHAPTDWQDEAAVFLLVGVTFGCGAWVQEQRGHIGMDALASILPGWANRARAWTCDALSLAFCLLFSWKSWTLTQEAWAGGYTTESTWSPPLWVPYSFMAIGMSLVCARLALQLASPLSLRERGGGEGAR